MRMKKRKKGCLIFLAVFLVGSIIFTWCQTPNRELGISKETTWYTEPLLEDGRVDYLTIQNRIYSEGVTNENNALIPMLEVLDLEMSSSPEYIDQLLRHLGLGKVEVQHKLMSHQKLLDGLFPIDPADEEANQKRETDLFAVDKPWKAIDYPQIAEVISKQSPALDIFVNATRRPRLFVPLIDEATSDKERILMAVQLPISQQMRSMAWTISVRAMNRLGDGDINGAIEDIKTIRRLARLVDQSPLLIDGLVSAAIGRIASDAETNLIQSPAITPEQLREYQAFLDEPQPFRVKFLERIGTVERCFALDTLTYARVYGFDAAGSLLVDASGLEPQLATAFGVLARSADMSEALRQVNRYFDETASLFETPDIRQRLVKAQAWNNTLDEKERQFNSFGRLARTVLSGPKARGRLLGDFITLLHAPALIQLYGVEVRAELADQLMHHAISIELYKRAVGHYPDSLAELQPDYVTEIPQDWFSTGEVTYTRTETGFVVYSFGEDHDDDGGLNYDDDSQVGRGDIRVRVGELPR